ncbi:MAG: hypothetical protein IPK83_03045 [Planctomycetes bacterium]|nr:hypothetical protein [Planctomycetota bacterium]
MKRPGHDGKPEKVATMMTLTHGGEHDAHSWLAKYVGFSWIIGMALAALLYRNGLGAAARIKKALGPIATFVERKYYIDEAYNTFLVMGCRTVGVACSAFDKIFVDGAVNLTAFFGKAIGTFTGRQLDMPVKKTDLGVVDAIANGIAGVLFDMGTTIRKPQSGRIRTYVTLTAGAAAVVLLLVLFSEQIGSGIEHLKRTWFVADAAPVVEG